MIRNLAALISLSVFFSGSFALSTQSVEGKTSQNNSRGARDYFVPPPPPYTPSIAAPALGITNAQAVTADSYGVVMEKPVNPYSNYTFKHNTGDMPQVVQPNPHLSVDPGVEKKIQKHIELFDSKITSIEEEIGKLLNL